jgi:hypothetical protein
MDQSCIHRRCDAARALRRVLGVAIVLHTGACAQLPDLAPFARATGEMAGAVRAAGPAVVSEVRLLEGGDEIASRLERSWEARAAALDVVAHYADSLASTVGSSRGNGEAAAAVARSIGELAGAAGAPVPPSALGAASDAARFIWAQVQLAAGARSLVEALAAAQPVVDRVAETLDADSTGLATIVRAAIENERTALESGPAYDAAVEAGDALERFRRVEVGRLIDAAASAGADGPTAESMDRLARIDALIASNNAQLAPFEARRRELDARGRELGRLVSAAGESVRRWAVAHRDLIAAMREHRAVDADSLLAAALEIRDLVKRAGDR